MIWRSKRPGRSSAGSSTSGRLVAAIRMTLVVDVEAVHLDEELVEGLLALVVAAADAGTAVAADGVDLVDEDDGRGVRLGLLEQVADAGGTDTDEHFDEVRAGDREERHAGLAGDGAGQQGLAGARRAVEQHALGDLGADGLELGRLLEELLDFLELLHGLVSTGDVGEGHLRHVLVDQLGLGLAELHDAPTPPPWTVVHQEDEQQDDERERQQDRQQRAAAGWAAGTSELDSSIVPAVDLLFDRREDRLLLADRCSEASTLSPRVAGALVEGRLDGLVTVDEGDLLDLCPRRCTARASRSATSSYPPSGREELRARGPRSNDRHDDPEPGAPEHALHRTYPLTIFHDRISRRTRRRRRICVHVRSRRTSARAQRSASRTHLRLQAVRPAARRRSPAACCRPAPRTCSARSE